MERIVTVRLRRSVIYDGRFLLLLPVRIMIGVRRLLGIIVPIVGGRAVAEGRLFLKYT